MARIHLSAPHMTGEEERFVREALETNWVSTVGPNLDAFEAAFGALVGAPCVALSSGTAAIHLGLRLLGVGSGDEVVCPTLTFVASANPILYLGARPIFVDADPRTWTLDPALLEDLLRSRAASSSLPRAIVVVHLFGQCADMDPILDVAARYGVPVLEDAAEALGATYKGRPAGSMGEVGAWSFNGNKIITTSGGGMLASRLPGVVEHARALAMQAREPGVGYEHVEMGYNYRMSNVLAGIGRAQLTALDDRVRRRRAIAFYYREAFADLPGIGLMPQASYGVHTNWLSCFLVDEAALGISRDGLLERLVELEIDARPVWRPMHLQPLFDGAERIGGQVAADLGEHGICLPSSSFLEEAELDRIVEAVRAASPAGGTR